MGILMAKLTTNSKPGFDSSCSLGSRDFRERLPLKSEAP